MIAKNKKTGSKYTHTKIIDMLKKIYPNNEIELRESGFVGDYILVKELNIKFEMNKFPYRKGKKFNDDSKNSYIITSEQETNIDEIIELFDLQKITV